MYTGMLISDMSELMLTGTLIFDEKDIELHADNILITDGGTLQVSHCSNFVQHSGEQVISLFIRHAGLSLYCWLSQFLKC